MMTSQIALIVEDYSPDEGPGRTLERMNQFLKRGVPLVWLVDAEDRSIAAFRRGDESCLFDETRDMAVKYIFPDAPVRVTELLPQAGEQR
jgi:Uma2 family endonuclease